MSITIDQIRKILPHDIPFLMVDGVSEQVSGEFSTFKNITGNEWFFKNSDQETSFYPEVMLRPITSQTLRFAPNLFQVCTKTGGKM